MSTKTRLLRGGDLDTMLRYPPGRSERLARKGQIPFLQLPDGQIRFDPDAITVWLNGLASESAEVPT